MAAEDPLAKLRHRNQRQKSDVAQKLVAMCLHALSAELVRRDPRLRVEDAAYVEAVREAFGVGCAFCTRALAADVHVEHLDAMNRCRAGLHVAGNVVLSCKLCNSAKRSDDQGRTRFRKVPGWEGFLSHDGTRCVPRCGVCKYWVTLIPSPAERTAFLEGRRAAIRCFRARFSADRLTTVSLVLADELEPLYRGWQNVASKDTATFRERALSHFGYASDPSA